MTIKDAMIYVDENFPGADELMKLKLMEAYLDGAMAGLKEAKEKI